MSIRSASHLAVAFLGALALLTLGASSSSAVPETAVSETAPDGAVVETAPAAAPLPVLEAVTPAAVTEYQYTSFTITGVHLADTAQVLANDVSFPFDVVSDTEITFTGYVGGATEAQIVVTNASGASNPLALTILPQVWEVPADDLSITYGQPAQLSGDFSRLTQHDALYFAVDDETFSPDSTTGSLASLTLAPRAFNAGRYDVVLGAYAPARAAQSARESGERPVGTLEVRKSPTTIAYELTDHTLRGTVSAAYDSVPTGAVVVTSHDGAVNATAPLDSAGAFSLSDFAADTAGFTLEYLGDLNHVHSITQETPTDPVDPVDPVDPTDPTGPTDPVDPANPARPAPTGTHGEHTPQTGGNGKLARTGGRGDLAGVAALGALLALFGAAGIGAAALCGRGAQDHATGRRAS